MAKGAGKALGFLADPFDITGVRRSKKKAAKLDARLYTSQQELAAKEAEEKAAADAAQAEKDAALKADELKKNKSAARQAGIAGISDTLAKEGADAGKRRFLTGAK